MKLSYVFQVTYTSADDPAVKLVTRWTKAELAADWPEIEAMLPDPETSPADHWHMKLVIDSESWEILADGILTVTSHGVHFSDGSDSTLPTDAPAASAGRLPRPYVKRERKINMVQVTSLQVGDGSMIRVLAHTPEGMPITYETARPAILRCVELQDLGLECNTFRHHPYYIQINGPAETKNA